MNRPNRIYLDYAAATPLDPEVERAMAPFGRDQFANPSSLYAEGRVASQALTDARHRIASSLGAKPSEIVLTAGGTEAVNLAILGVGRRFPGTKVAALSIEHQAVLACLDALKTEGHSTRLIKVNNNGLAKPESIKQAVDDQTALIAVGLANSEIGTIQPLGKIAQVVQAIRTDRAKRGISLPLYLMSDASAAAGYHSLQVSRLRVDLLVVNGAKIYGPKQAGVLYVRTGVELTPLIYGGGQERGLRSGTESVGAAIGLAQALELAEASRPSETKRLTELRARLTNNLLAIPDVTLNGDPNSRLPGNINLTIGGVRGEDLVYHLDAAGVATATGAACSASSDQPSSVLLAIGRTAAQANQSLRLTLGRPTTTEEVKVTADIIATTITKLRGQSFAKIGK